MQPPSDAFLHHCHKLREAATKLRNCAAFTPPPPYSSTDTRDPIQERQIGRENEDDNYTWDDSPVLNPNLITINIDASISVVGNNNTIMIPSMPAIAQQGTNKPSSRVTSEEAVFSPLSAGNTEASALKSAQEYRQAKLAEMATSIINALYESGRLNTSGENCESAPAEININTGIKVEGSRNAVYVGVPVRLQSSKGNQRGSEKQQFHINRKKRALSEPPEVPISKKKCLI